MKIKGLQKTTLIDYPKKVACTIFLFGCNFRCGFCHNPELVLEEKGEDISVESFLDFLKKRNKYLEGVCITGGEPLLTLKKDFLIEIKKLNYNIKIDTNGSFPELLKEIINEKLVDFVAMDVKSSKEKYKEITNSDVDVNKIEESIKIISKLENYEFRTTIIEDFHSLEEMKKIAIWLNDLIGKKPKKLCLQGFMNNGKFIDESFNFKKNTSESFLEKIKEEIKNYFEEIEIRF
jgi:pyruvate formate lyase activating enzyme